MRKYIITSACRRTVTLATRVKRPLMRGVMCYYHESNTENIDNDADNVLGVIFVRGSINLRRSES